MWLVINIGCLHCDISSNVVGLFADRAEAEDIAKNLKVSHNWREGGQNCFEVFALPEVGVIAPEYLRPIDD